MRTMLYLACVVGESFFDEGLWIQGDQVGLVLVDALVVSGIERSSFFCRKSEVGKTLAGAHLSGAQDPGGRGRFGG